MRDLNLDFRSEMSKVDWPEIWKIFFFSPNTPSKKAIRSYFKLKSGLISNTWTTYVGKSKEEQLVGDIGRRASATWRHHSIQNWKERILYRQFCFVVQTSKNHVSLADERTWVGIFVTHEKMCQKKVLTESSVWEL